MSSTMAPKCDDPAREEIVLAKMTPQEQVLFKATEVMLRKHINVVDKSGATLGAFTHDPSALLADLWRPDLQVPLVPFEGRSGVEQGWTSDSVPSLLWHGLGDRDKRQTTSKVYLHIDKEKDLGPTCLYGTSGVGKTRSILEYLSHNMGFLFVYANQKLNGGSSDLKTAFRNLDVVTAKDPTSNGTSQKNLETIQRRVWVLLYIRHRVYGLLTEHLGRQLTPYEWLLYQVFPEHFLGGDIFLEAFEELQGFSDGAAKTLRNQIDRSWSIFVDESQALLRIQGYFLCSSGTRFRSGFSGLAKALNDDTAFKCKMKHPVFSGTGLSFDELSDEAMSATGKGPTQLASRKPVHFTGFELFSTEDVVHYLDRYLDLSRVRDDVKAHVANWLRGRPRWTASFLEVYIMRRETPGRRRLAATRTRGKMDGRDSKLIEALDRYLNVMTCEEKETNRRESWSAGESSAYYSFRKVMNWTDCEDSTEVEIKMVQDDLRIATCDYAVGKRETIFDENSSKRLIFAGVAAVRVVDTEKPCVAGYLDEPIIVEAGVNYFSLEAQLRRNLRNQEPDGQGQAFERLLLPSLLQDTQKLHSVCKKQLGDNMGNLEDFMVSVRSSYGVLALDTGSVRDKSKIQATLEWIEDALKAKFEGQVPPFCYPDTLIGPDVIFLMHNESFDDFRTAVVQSKYSVAVNPKAALITLVPGKFYTESRGKEGKEKTTRQMTQEQAEVWNELKGTLVSDKRPCLRLLVQTPADSTAESGLIAADDYLVNDSSNQKKRDWLVVLDGSQEEELLAKDALAIVRLLKRRRKNVETVTG